MNKYTLLLVAGILLSLFSCTKVSTVLPATPVPPSTNYITVTEGSSNVFDINPVCNITNLISTSNTSVLTINMQINNSSTFNMSLTVYGDTTDKGKFTAYNSLTDADAFSQFSNNGHGVAFNTYDYIIDSAVVTVSSLTVGPGVGTDAVTGAYQLWLQPNRNSLAKAYKTVSGTFNSTGVTVSNQ